MSQPTGQFTQQRVSDLPPYIVGFGGTMRIHSSSERAGRAALEAAAALGARTRFFTATELAFPMYPGLSGIDGEHAEFIEAVRQADGFIIASPGYHGGMSGLIKNALDYTEDLRDNERPYLEGRAVGCIVTAAGWQATASTLAMTRSVIHALRGWPTPLGVCINTTTPSSVDIAQEQLVVLARQVVDFASRMQHA